MNGKVISAGIIIIAALIFGMVSFVESNVEYMDFAKAERTAKKVQVKGKWIKDKDAVFNAEKAQFTFYMADDNNRECKVVLEGAKPNNFEHATEIVVKGKLENGYFHASEILTKCPSKYEGDASAVKKTI